MSQCTHVSMTTDKLVSAWVAEGYLDRGKEAGIKMALNKPHKHVHDYKMPAHGVSNLLTIKEAGQIGSSVSLQSIEKYDNEGMTQGEQICDQRGSDWLKLGHTRDFFR